MPNRGVDAPSPAHGCHPSPSSSTESNRDRKSTRLNSSHSQISYAVFCLKKKTANEHRLHSPIPAHLVYYYPTIIGALHPPERFVAVSEGGAASCFPLSALRPPERHHRRT